MANGKRHSIHCCLSNPCLVCMPGNRCQKCGCETKGEEAWVNGQIWCHPCADATPQEVTLPVECTDDMAHAMSRLDGYDHDRDMPTLQRWKDYWDAAVAEFSSSLSRPQSGGAK